MWQVGRFAGLLVLAFLIVSHLDSSVLAAPQASKASPPKGASSKPGAANTSPSRARGSEKSADTKTDSTDSARSGDTDTKEEDGNQPTKRLSYAEKKEATIVEAREAVKEMIRKLGKGEYLEFMHQHIPIEEYVRMLRSGEPVTIPLSAIPSLIQMSATLEKLQDGDATIDKAGRVVSFRAKEGAKVEKVIQNPYSKKAEDVPAYQGDLPEVIATALKDLKAEQYEACMSRVLPPSTIHLMKTDGRWDGMMESLSPESPMVTAMITDLMTLSKAKASIDGDTAEYRFPNVIHRVARNDVEEEDAGERIIRFSKINGAWRFFDSNVKTSEQLDAALKREVKGEIAEDQLVVEKIGSDWRLLHIPGMPRVRPLQ